MERTLSSYTFVACVLTGLLAMSSTQVVRGAEPSTEASLQLIDVTEESSPPRALSDGSEVPGLTRAYFEVRIPSNGGYLYLLQKSAGSLQVLSPATGLVWMNRPGETMRVVPSTGQKNDDGEQPTSWSPEQSGELEFILVRAPAPRDVPSDTRVTTLDEFLAPPPFVRGPLAAPAQVLSRLTLVWL